MYFNIHSGSCAPAERDLPSLATVFSQPLRAASLQGSIAQIRQHIGIHLAERQGEAERRDPDLALLSLAARA
jgi:hypothetical protein